MTSRSETAKKLQRALAKLTLDRSIYPGNRKKIALLITEALRDAELVGAERALEAAIKECDVLVGRYRRLATYTLEEALRNIRAIDLDALLEEK